jgi:hypothetical protein
MSSRWETARHTVAATLVAAAAWIAIDGDWKPALGLLAVAGALMAVDVVAGYRTGRALRDAYRRHRQGRGSC